MSIRIVKKNLKSLFFGQYKNKSLNLKSELRILRICYRLCSVLNETNKLKIQKILNKKIGGTQPGKR